MQNISPNVLVFKTNISSQSEIRKLDAVLNRKSVLKWNVDTEDCDRVLRIVSQTLRPDEVIDLAEQCGFECMELN
jgi:hypothetical protein